MTNLYSPTPLIDLPTLDGSIGLHLRAYSRNVRGDATTNTSETSAVTSLVLMDPGQDLFEGRSEALFGYRLYCVGFDAALALTSLTSQSPFHPNEVAIAAVLGQTRFRIAETIAEERAKWGLPA